MSSHSFPTGTYVTQVTATDADDPTYGNSARVVYSILHGQPYFSVDPKTGTYLLKIYGTKSCFSRCEVHKCLHSFTLSFWMFDSKENQHLYYKIQQGREIRLSRLERYVWLSACVGLWTSASIYHENKTGSRNDPWGTPQISGPRKETCSPIETVNYLLDRYEIKGWLYQTAAQSVVSYFQKTLKIQ